MTPKGLRGYTLAALIAIGAVCLPPALCAQVAPAKRISGKPSCGACRLQFDTVFRVNGASGPQSIARAPISATRDKHGQVYVIADVLPRVFNSSGRFVRDLGRRGSGPGEFQAVSAVAAVGQDTVAFFDAAVSRISYFDTAGRFLGSVTVPVGGAVFSLASLPGGAFAVTGRFSKSNVMALGHVIAKTGDITVSFAPSSVSGEQGKWITANRRGSIVANDLFDHTFEQFDLRGRSVGRFAIDADWFAASTEWPELSPRGPAPRTYTPRSWLADDGLLWLFTHVPRRDWQRGIRRARAGRGYVEDGFLTRDTRIEVVDLAAPAVLISTSVAHYQLIPLGDGYFAAYNETGDGNPELTVIRIRLVR